MVEERDEAIARAFNDYRRSTALMQLVVTRHMGLVTDEQLSGGRCHMCNGRAILTTVLMLASAVSSVDAGAPVNLASQKELSSGKGLAAVYPADVGLRADPHHEMKISPDKKYWGNSFDVPEVPAIQRGRWICVEFMLKHNTPGQADGEQAFWIDGVLLGHWKGINWRKTTGLQANALTIESYVTDRWTKNPVNVVSFDNVVIARRYIGTD
jgi:hypothetical protein